jgi:hypothetical protein
VAVVWDEEDTDSPELFSAWRDALRLSGLGDQLGGMSPDYDECRKVVNGFESYGVNVSLHRSTINGKDDVWIGNPEHGFGREPLELWHQFRALDRQVLEKYLKATGRVW